MNLANILGFVQLGLQLAPTVVGSVETLFGKQPAATTPEQKAAISGAKAEAALKMAQAGLTAALGIDPEDFGPPEQQLIKSVNDAVVAYFNSKGWPTQ